MTDRSAERARIVELDKHRVWHPYTAMDLYRATVDPIVAVRATGSRIEDADGSSYVDANASWWVAALGHDHPRLVAALKRQADELCHVPLAGITHSGAAELGEALCRSAPTGLDHVFYSDDGSTAVEVALKLSLQYWAQNGRPGRATFVALEGGFHGETLGVTALGGVEAFRRPFARALPSCLHVPSPADGLEAAVAALRTLLARRADEIAALVVEPMVQGAAGMRIYEAEYLRAVRELCDAYDVFLVCDEVFTGYGRTGPMWACEHAGIAPDLLCSAKGLTGGMLPMGATLANDRLFDGFLEDSDRAFLYGHSYCGNPLGTAVAVEVLRVFEEEKVLEGVRRRARRIAAAFEAMAELAAVSATRSLGMIGALDLAGDEGYLAYTGWAVYEEARKRGVYLRPLGNVVYVTPPLTIPDEDLDLLLDVVHESVEAATRSR
ncbi:MAG: adenosylmethionine--8-amino-7-oxononanoate transaminase [Myxococcota bacterium]